MDLSTLRPADGSRKKRKRIGRGPGSGHGKTSGKGHKGQKARSGYSRKAGFEGGQMPLIRRMPKRGFHHENRHEMAEVNLDVLDAHFEEGAQITPEAVVEKGLAKELPGGVKVLGRGDVSKKWSVKVNGISAGARSKIEGAGGSVEILVIPPAKAVVRREKRAAK